MQSPTPSSSLPSSPPPDAHASAPPSTDALGKVLDRAANVSQWLAWIGGAMLLLCAILISLDVIFRALLKETFFESFELSTYAFAISTALGMSYALASRAHIRIEVVYQTLPVAWRGWLDVFAYSALALSAGVMLYWCGLTVWDNYETGARSNSSLALPLVIPQSMWLVGLAWFAVLAILYAVYGLVKCLSGRPDLAHKRLGVASLEEEINANVSLKDIQS